MLRRTQTVYISVDSLLSSHGRVLHHFDRFLARLAAKQIPCVWMTGRTRAQLDEPRRRLGQSDPYIGENGCGVYLPEDYFHLKGSKTVRMGRYTCVPVAEPQPAAAEALEELSSDLGVSVVPLRKLSQRELSQNTGLSGKEAELVRMRDFDELFFFAGAFDAVIGKFHMEAKARGLTLERAGPFWSLSCGGDLAKCVSELGRLYDRALHSHALRIGVRVTPNERSAKPTAPCEQERWPSAAFDRIVSLSERPRSAQLADSEENSGEPSERTEGTSPEPAMAAEEPPHEFRLASPTVWDELLAFFEDSAAPRRASFP
jgi:predicted mannosyl-3-phosphoglycerate phosphatase (HAD superfamily)